MWRPPQACSFVSPSAGGELSDFHLAFHEEPGFQHDHDDDDDDDNDDDVKGDVKGDDYDDDDALATWEAAMSSCLLM